MAKKIHLRSHSQVLDKSDGTRSYSAKCQASSDSISKDELQGYLQFYRAAFLLLANKRKSFSATTTTRGKERTDEYEQQAWSENIAGYMTQQVANFNEDPKNQGTHEVTWEHLPLKEDFSTPTGLYCAKTAYSTNFKSPFPKDITELLITVAQYTADARSDLDENYLFRFHPLEATPTLTCDQFLVHGAKITKGEAFVDRAKAESEEFEQLTTGANNKYLRVAAISVSKVFNNMWDELEH